MTLHVKDATPEQVLAEMANHPTATKPPPGQLVLLEERHVEHIRDAMLSIVEWLDRLRAEGNECDIVLIDDSKYKVLVSLGYLVGAYRVNHIAKPADAAGTEKIGGAA